MTWFEPWGEDVSVRATVAQDRCPSSPKVWDCHRATTSLAAAFPALGRVVVA